VIRTLHNDAEGRPVAVTEETLEEFEQGVLERAAQYARRGHIPQMTPEEVFWKYKGTRRRACKHNARFL
jgi:hypothetical protein